MSSFGVVLKKNIHNYLKRLLKKFFPSPATYLNEAGVSLHTSTKTTLPWRQLGPAEKPQCEAASTPFRSAFSSALELTRWYITVRYLILFLTETSSFHYHHSCFTDGKWAQSGEITCQGSPKKGMSLLEIVKSNLFPRPLCVLSTGHCALCTEKVMRLGSPAVPSTAIPVAVLSCVCGIGATGAV